MNFSRFHVPVHRDAVMFVFVVATLILAIVWSVFSASTLSSTQLGVGTSTPGAAIAVRGGFLVAGGDARILGPINVSSIIATSTSVNSGVGTSSPGALFSVGGVILSGSAGATSTNIGNEAIKQNMTIYGNLEVLGSCTGCLGTSGISGSGTANRVAKFTAGATIGDSIITDTGTNVGIGTTTPGSLLSVHNGETYLGGAVLAAGNVKAAYFIATSSTASFFNFASSTSLSLSNLLNVSGLGTSTLSGGTTVATGGGSFGVGTTSPGSEVGIVGDTFQSSGGTTTQTIHSTSATQGGCIELESPSVPGEWVRLYVGGFGATNTASSAVIQAQGRAILVVELGRCQ